MLVAKSNQPRGIRPLGRIVSTHPGQDGMVRAVTVRTQYGEYKRPNKTVFLRGSGELGLETVKSSRLCVATRGIFSEQHSHELTMVFLRFVF